MESHTKTQKDTGFKYDEKTVDGYELGDFVDITAEQAEPQPTETDSDSASLSDSLSDSPSASLPSDNNIQDVVNELKRLTLSVEGVETSNQRMLEILVGLVKLDIRSPNPTARDEPTNMTTCMASSQKRKTFDNHNFLTGISTVILSDDDQTVNTSKIQFGSADEFHATKIASKSKMDKGKSPMAHTSTNAEKDWTNDKLMHSNFKRSPHAKILLNDDAVVAKKLSFTPSPTNISFKRQKKMSPSDVAAAKSCLASPGSTSTMATKGKLPPRPFRPHIFKSSGGILPKYVKCTFRPTVDMRLTAEEAILCAYIFRDDFQSKNELVFSMGNNVFIRSEFQCLVPGGYVGRQIVYMMALKVTWAQKHALTQNLWCLPHSFASDVQSGYSAEKLVVIYGHEWMPAFKKLKLIYVPIVDEGGHWCLMVVHIVERKIYLLDSHLVAEKVEERHRMLKQIAAVLSQMVLTIYDFEVDFCLFPDFEFWDIEEPRGVPNCGHSENAGLWVAEWINMQNAFNNQIVGVMDEKQVRMKIAMRLLLGPHNDYKEILARDAKKHWEEVEALKANEMINLVGGAV